jgi:hypothetical protein
MDKKYYTDPPKIWAIALWLLFCSVAVLWVFTAPGKAGREPIKWLYIVFLGCFCLMYVRWYWNYPIVGRDSLIIKNLLFSSKIYRYEDIEYLEMVCNNSKGTGLAVKLKNKRFRKSVFITCVAIEQLDELYLELNQKGVIVKR